MMVWLELMKLMAVGWLFFSFDPMRITHSAYPIPHFDYPIPHSSSWLKNQGLTPLIHRVGTAISSMTSCTTCVVETFRKRLSGRRMRR